MLSRLTISLVLIAAAIAVAGRPDAAAPPQTPTPAARPDVIWIPSDDRVVTAMLKLAGVTKTDVVYDLGCGDGKIVIAAAKTFGARGVGIEIDPEQVKAANAAIKAAGVAGRVTIIQGNIFDPAIKINDATVVTLFLLQSLNEKLRPRLEAELKPGTRIVSNAFHMGNSWPAERSEDVGNTTIYLWTIPNRAPLLQLRHEPVE
jgi:SAM-dependent methyltransferase